MSRRKRRVWTRLCVCVAALLGFACWWQGWLFSEPSYRGKTVTRWLDTMTLFDQERDADERLERAPSPAVVASDPALRALRHIGSNAVPVLVHRLSEPPLWKPSDRLKAWLEWKWDQVRSRRAIPRPSPPNYCSPIQRARKMAAAFTLLALGTNANAGFTRAMEACTVAPSIASNEPPIQFVFMAVSRAGRSLPRSREQIIDEITAAMNHTNAFYRGSAASVTRYIGNPYPPAWKDILGRLTQDVDANVRREALWSLGIIAKGDDDVVRLAEAALRDAKNSAPVRAVAAMALGWAGAKATNALPLLREAQQDPDRHLQFRAREAIRAIEDRHSRD